MGLLANLAISDILLKKRPAMSATNKRSMFQDIQPYPMMNQFVHHVLKNTPIKPALAVVGTESLSKLIRVRCAKNAMI
ncbi:hypothetical protein B0181_07810 [Moraxella caviae]|uniref:Uncharacterized protein n=1 Tax=Moraxella caviae TaxID=34060 RepID=A0A1S9ZYU3_9GAMM|nr:hypothetical protein B0181_07810 [Moraxella caviae]